MLISLISFSMAGSRWLQNDGFEDGDAVYAQGGFISGECWASVYVPDASDYPFDLDTLRALVAGSNDQVIFTVTFYNLSGTTMSGTIMGSEGMAVTGSDSSWNDLYIPDLELDLPQVTEGNIGVSVCFDEHSGYPGIVRDDDGMAYRDRNYIYADAGAGAQWYKSSDFGISGDWVMRLCITGSGVADEGCDEGGGGGGDDTGNGGGGGDDTGSPNTGELSLITISPNTAEAGATTSVVILGSGFADGAEARIGGIPITGLTVVNAETLSGYVPTALPAGTHDVEVVMDGETAVLLQSFTLTGGCGCNSTPSTLWASAMLLSLVVVRRRTC